ncbi:AlpA family phage regulatory protein [Pseudomonas sp. MWU12-2345]|uniref:helix-turn-helix transcriptional regulator n=1 Tax=Pseudomonas sp. MWU12-2345 TaxID=2928689 RepID=UPI00200BC4CD|nr:AlpA family phage regulatory protein [Pseudomonas sp. MWU12-2345]
MEHPQEKPPVEFIRLSEVKRLTGLSTATIYRMVAADRFPKQIKLGIQAVAWIQSEVLTWNQQKVDEARASESPMDSDKAIGKIVRE